MSTFNYEGHYICKCGKEFSNSQKFNGHKTQCKEHLISVGKYQNREHLQSLFKTVVAIKGATKQSKLCNSRKQERLLQWVGEKHCCERCGKIMTEKYGTGRFCSSHCAHSRPQTDNTRHKISDSVSEWLINDGNHKNTHFKCGNYQGFYCQSSYELAFLAYTLLSGTKIRRASDRFKYINPTDGKEHQYVPDFYLPDTDTYVEIKSEFTTFFNFDEVTSKCSSVQQCGHGMLYINDSDIKHHISFIKHHFKVKDITALYESA